LSIVFISPDSCPFREFNNIYQWITPIGNPLVTYCGRAQVALAGTSMGPKCAIFPLLGAIDEEVWRAQKVVASQDCVQALL